MWVRRTSALSLLLLFSSTAFGNSKIVETKSATVQLVKPEGTETATLVLLSRAETVQDILFRTVLSEPIPQKAWAFEVNEPESQESYRFAQDGNLPEIIHWDGVFSSGRTIAPGKAYFYRVLLISAEGTISASRWQSFRVRQGKSTDNLIKSEPFNFHAIPSGTVYWSNLRAGLANSTHLPALRASLRFAYKDHHSFGIQIETTPSLISNVAVTGSGFFYSSLVLFYSYRLRGSIARPPVIPLNPGFLGSTAAPPALPASAFGAKSNLEVSFRFYSTVLRGFGSQYIDSILARQMDGISMLFSWDRRLGRFRLHTGLEGGYSLFKGSIVMGQASLGFTYDRFEHIAPGIEARYLVFAGNAADDDFDDVTGGGATSIFNQLLMLGMVFNFRL